MRILLDTNIILDFFLERHPFYSESSRLFEAIAENNLEGFFSGSSAIDLWVHPSLVSLNLRTCLESPFSQGLQV